MKIKIRNRTAMYFDFDLLFNRNDNNFCKKYLTNRLLTYKK